MGGNYSTIEEKTDDSYLEKMYEIAKNNNLTLNQQFTKCINYLQKKPWEKSKISKIIITHESDNDDKSMFDSPVDTSNIICDYKNFKNYTWYLPSKKLFDFLCLLDYKEEDNFVCNVQKSIRKFTNEAGKEYSFIIGVVYKDNTCKILDRKDYIKECQWWTNDYNIIRFANIHSTEGEVVRKKMKKKLKKVLKTLHHELEDIDEDNMLIKTIDKVFIKKIKENETATIYQYVYDLLFFINFIDVKSPLYNYTQSLREKILSSSFNTSYIPLLTFKDAIPQDDKGILEELTESYLSFTIEKFFNKVAKHLRYNTREVKDFQERNKIKYNVKEKLREYCVYYNFDEDVEERDILTYKDSDTDKIYCFTVQQIINSINSSTSKDKIQNPVDRHLYLDTKFIEKFKQMFNVIEEEEDEYEEEEEEEEEHEEEEEEHEEEEEEEEHEEEEEEEEEEHEHEEEEKKKDRIIKEKCITCKRKKFIVIKTCEMKDKGPVVFKFCSIDCLTDYLDNKK